MVAFISLLKDFLLIVQSLKVHQVRSRSISDVGEKPLSEILGNDKKILKLRIEERLFLEKKKRKIYIPSWSMSP